MNKLKNRLMSALLAFTMVLTGISGLEGIAVANAATAEVKSIAASPSELTYRGGNVKLTVEGTNLTAENWGVEAKAYISGTDMERSFACEVKDVTEKSATLVVPANTYANDLEFRVTAGAKDGASISEQAKTTFIMKGKPYKTDTTFFAESAQLIGNSQVRINFDSNMKLYCTEEEAADLFSVVDSSKKKLDCKATSVEVDGKSVLVTFDSAIPKEAASVAFGEGIFDLGMKAGKPLVNGANTHILTKVASISDIDFEKDVLNSKAGTVKVTLDGFKVEDISLDSITANVFAAGVSTKTDIEVNKTAVNGKPVLTFTLPENKTKGTQCYILKVYQNGKEVITTATRESRNVVSVLPAGKTDKDQTLGMATIVAMRNTGNTDLQNAVAEVSKSIGELKTEVRLYGTNLDSTKTKLRAIDENGIEWPVYDIPECDGMWRFVAIAGTNKNGVFGEGNSQLVELLPPRYAGTNKKYTIQVSIDGEHWLDTNTVTLTVNNEGIAQESDFRNCNKDDIKTITVKHVNENGKEIAESDRYQCYGVSMLRQFPIGPKEIEGYTLDEEKNPTLHDWVYEGPTTYTYTYKVNAPMNLKKASVKGIADKTYTGKAITQKISVALDGKTVDGKNYTVSYKNNTKVGVATVVITGKGHYTGSITKKFKINPKAVALSSVKAKKKAVKVTWKKSANKVSGYQVSYGTARNFKKAKTANVKYTKKVNSKTIKKLKSKKKYYVRVRTYTKTSGGTCYSTWSKVKTAKVK
nr:MucBP domain-containing protein [uncultured Mogibacterium sp.]